MRGGPTALRFACILVAAALPECQCFHPVCVGRYCGEDDGGDDGGFVALDAGPTDANLDAGVRDGGFPPDAGGLLDAGLQDDAGNPLDSGNQQDAGETQDGGAGADAGGATDAGDIVDAGGMTDAGAGVDGGNTFDAGFILDAGWQYWSVTPLPPPRSEFMMTYDSTRDRVVLFGGAIMMAANDTWEWTGNAWQQISTTSAPSARYASEIAYDAKNQFTVLFSGDPGFAAYPPDTWIYRGGPGGWSAVPLSGPPGRRSYAMAYDSAQQATVIYGGWAGGGGYLTDTWQWDGGSSAWTMRAATGPLGTFRPAMAFDEARGEMLLYGGSTDAFQTCPNARAETWEWNDSNGVWTQLMPVHSPPPLAGHTMVYDSNRQRVVLFAGCSNSGPNTLNADIWEWDGADWTQVSVSGPMPRWLHGMAFQSARGTSIVFGGVSAQMQLDDTWEYTGP